MEQFLIVGLVAGGVMGFIAGFVIGEIIEAKRWRRAATTEAELERSREMAGVPGPAMIESDGKVYRVIAYPDLRIDWGEWR